MRGRPSALGSRAALPFPRSGPWVEAFPASLVAPARCAEPAGLAEEDCSLEQFLPEGSGKAVHEYDFGNSWLHRLELVSRERAGPDSPLAWLVNGSRRGQNVLPTASFGKLIRRRTAGWLVAGMA